MKKFIFSGTIKANYALLAKAGSAFLLLGQKNRAAEILQFSAADTIPSHAGMFKETDRLSVQLERVCCTLSFSEFFRTQCGIFPEKHLQILKYYYFSVIS